MHEIELKPSRLMGLLALGIALLALVAIAHADLPVAAQSALAAGVAGVLAWQWRSYGRDDALRVRPDGRLQRRTNAGEWQDVEILGESFVTPALVVARYRAEDGRVRQLALLPDSASPDDFRRLRVSLRWSRRTRSDTGSPGAG